MTEMSAAEAAVVARFEAGEPAPESWGGGLREALVEAIFDHHPMSRWGAKNLADAVLALPEVAALRAKADAADRVEALVSAWTNMAQPQSWGTKLYAIRRALDVSDRTDRGRC